MWFPSPTGSLVQFCLVQRCPIDITILGEGLLKVALGCLQRQSIRVWLFRMRGIWDAVLKHSRVVVVVVVVVDVIFVRSVTDGTKPLQGQNRISRYSEAL